MRACLLALGPGSQAGDESEDTGYEDGSVVPAERIISSSGFKAGWAGGLSGSELICLLENKGNMMCGNTTLLGSVGGCICISRRAWHREQRAGRLTGRACGVRTRAGPQTVA